MLHLEDEMIIGVSDRFVPLVLNGTKTGTIRRGKRWKVGMIAALVKNFRRKKEFMGLRQVAGQELLFRARVIGVSDCYLRKFDKPCKIVDCWLNEGRITQDALADLAWEDGFRKGGSAGVFEMAEFLMPDGEDFDGQQIQWDYEGREK